MKTRGGKQWNCRLLAVHGRRAFGGGVKKKLDLKHTCYGYYAADGRGNTKRHVAEDIEVRFRSKTRPSARRVRALQPYDYPVQNGTE